MCLFQILINAESLLIAKKAGIGFFLSCVPTRRLIYLTHPSYLRKDRSQNLLCVFCFNCWLTLIVWSIIWEIFCMEHVIKKLMMLYQCWEHIQKLLYLLLCSGFSKILLMPNTWLFAVHQGYCLNVICCSVFNLTASEAQHSEAEVELDWIFHWYCTALCHWLKG